MLTDSKQFHIEDKGAIGADIATYVVLPHKEASFSKAGLFILLSPSRCDAASLRENIIRLLTDREQFHIEDKGAVGADIAAYLAAAVSQLGGDEEAEFAAHLHQLHTFRPSCNDLA